MVKVVADTDKFLTFFQTLKPVANDGLLRIEDGKFKVTAIDLANVIFMYSFCNFDVEDSLEVGVKFDKVYDALLASGSEKSELDITHDKIHIKTGLVNHNYRTLNAATLKKIPKIPEIGFPLEVEVDRKEFTEIVNTISSMQNSESSDMIATDISYSNKKLTMFCGEQSGDYIDSTFEITSTQTKGIKDSFKSRYGVEYLVNVVKVINKIKPEKVSIYFGNNMPMRLRINEGDLDVSYLLAQRVDGVE